MNRVITSRAALVLICLLILFGIGGEAAWGQTIPPMASPGQPAADLSRPATRPQASAGPFARSPSPDSPSPGPPTTAPPKTESPSSGHGVLQIIFSGGITGTLILALLALLSFIAMALGVEHLLTIRRAVLIPTGLANTVRQFLTRGDLRSARAACQAQPSTLATVLEAGFDEAASGWPSMEKAMEQSLAAGLARLLRKIDYLSVIGNIAPMLGLLGTVFGMIFAFQEVADTQGAARAAELASGIYQALVTTVGGLMVAIPSLAAFAVFRNRVDALIAETAHAAGQATGPLKQALAGLPAGTEPQEGKPLPGQAKTQPGAPARPTTPPAMPPTASGRIT